AAGEMRDRLLHALSDAEGPEPEADHAARTWHLARAVLVRDHQLQWQLTANPGRLAIQTIDSFNAALVRKMPWLARFGALPEMADDSVPLYRQAAERTLARLGDGTQAGTAVARLLTHLDNRMDRLRDMLMALLQRRDQWLRHLVWDDHAAQRRLLEAGLVQLTERLLEAARRVIPAAFEAGLLRLGRYAAASLPDGGKARPLQALSAVEAFPGTSAAELPLWQALADLLLTTSGQWRKRLDKNCGFPTGSPQAVAAKTQMSELLDALAGGPDAATALAAVREAPPGAYADTQWEVLQALVDVLPLAVAELWLVFGEEGQTDFAEIALKALGALREGGAPSELLLRLDTRINHVLVDEFQDTSHLQYALLLELTSGWMPGDGRTLFLVGDPMQSIYRFREAEVGLFLRTRRKGLGTVNLEPLELTSNFRSQAGIVGWVNRAFSEAFPAVEDPSRGAVRYAEAMPVRQAVDGEAVSLHLLEERDDLVEAQQVAELARDALEASAAGSVAILVRSRSHLALILPALRTAGLRYQSQDIDPLASRPVAKDLIALTRALLHPADDLSWLAVLRAPWCGLTLADLHGLCAGRDSLTLPERLSDAAVLGRLSPDGRQRAERARAILFDAAGRRGRVGLRRLVEGCWLALGGPAVLDAAGEEDAGMVLSLLESLESGGDLPVLDGFDDALANLFAAPDADADGRLQVMTIHKAKGLEFDTVILPGLGRLPRGGETPLLRWVEHSECGLLLAPIAPRDGGSRDPIYDAIGRLEKEQSEYEAGRLLYVAATRARQRLHLLGHAGQDKNGTRRAASGSFLRQLQTLVAQHGEGAAPPGAETEAKEPPAVIRRLAQNWTPPLWTPAPLPATSATLQPSAIRDDEEDVGDSGWGTDTARHIGTVAHFYLERIGREGATRWGDERLAVLAPAVRRRLEQLGVPQAKVDEAQTRVMAAVRQSLASERGFWLLGPRRKGECEIALSGVVAGQLVHAQIDRTFLDEQGRRWVIDYKTSRTKPGEATATFLEREGERYRGQLAIYVALLRELEPQREVRAALYFPMIDGWWEFNG
ncbi:MAG TPA: 3'-5' exonuclease, partial [Desulfuromonadales bacterium]|nr:3'-5' exonuclease [Desulfuromonadales bacterium]